MAKDNYDKIIKKAISWMAVTHHYMVAFNNDLKKLERDVKSAAGKKSAKDIRRAFKDFRMVGRSESRFDNMEKEVERELNRIVHNHPVSIKSKTWADHHGFEQKDIKKVLSDIHDEAMYVLTAVSRYEGRLLKRLKLIQAEVGDNSFQKAWEEVVNLESEVKKVMKFMDGLIAGMEDSEGLVRHTDHQLGSEISVKAMEDLRPNAPY